MFSDNSVSDRAKRYRLEAAYLRTLIRTLRDPEERAGLATIAETYERVADALTQLVDRI